MLNPEASCYANVIFLLSPSLFPPCVVPTPPSPKKRSHVPRSPLLCMEFFKDSPRRERKEDIKWTSLRRLQRMKFEKTKKSGKGAYVLPKLERGMAPFPERGYGEKKCTLFLKRRLGKEIRASETQKGFAAN